VEEKEYMRLLHYPSSNKHLILLKPAFEKWVFQQAAIHQKKADGFKQLKQWILNNQGQNSV